MNKVEEVIEISSSIKTKLIKISALEILSFVEVLDGKIKENEGILKEIKEEYTSILTIKKGLLNVKNKIEVKQNEYYKIIRKNIREYFFLLSVYTNELNYYEDMLLNHLDYKVDKDKSIISDINLCNAIRSKYHNNPDSIEDKIPEMIRILPMYITKDKYYSYIKDMVKRNLSGHSKKYCEAVIDMYKYYFSGYLYSQYGFRFDKYFYYIENMKRLDFSQMKKDELEILYKEMQGIFKEIHEISEILRVLGLIANRYIILSMIDCDRAIKNESKSSRKNGTVKLHIVNDDSVLEHQINKNSNVDALFESLKNENLELNEILIKYGEEAISEEDKNKLNVAFEYLEDRAIKPENMIDFNEEAIEREHLNLMVKTFIDFLGRCVVNMNRDERKIRMKRMMSIVGVPFKNIDECIQYIDYSLKRCTDIDKKERFIKRIIELID